MPIGMVEINLKRQRIMSNVDKNVEEKNPVNSRFDINISRCIYRMKYNEEVEMNELLFHTTIWIHFESMILSRRSQTRVHIVLFHLYKI